MNPRVDLVPIPVDVLRMLADYDLVGAGRAMDMPMPPSTLDSQWVWSAFALRIASHPDHAFWYTQYFAVEDGHVVGDVRMHAPPSDGVVTIGYQVVPIERRRGVAVAATRALLTLAEARPEVGLFVALVSPNNVASLKVCDRLGFVDVGEEQHAITGQMMRRLERSPQS